MAENKKLEQLIILGAGLMQGPVIRIARELGFLTIALDGRADAPCIALADQFEQIDLKDKEGIEAFARSLQESGRLVGIMTAGTDFSASAAWAAEKLGLPGIPYEAALNASDKSRMRACFKNAGLPSPEFLTITASDAIKEQDLPCSFPLVIKPVDNMGGRGCRRVDSMAEFQTAAEDALKFSRSGRAIVERYMEGPEFSVDAIIYHGEISICGLADRHIFFPPYFIEMGHTMPTAIAPDQQEAILDVFCQGIRSLGLAGKESIGAAKGDIKLCSQGPMIGEIAARLSGGYMSGWTYPYSSGVQPVKAAILMATGRKPGDLSPEKNHSSAERAFISIPGTVKSISGLAEAQKRPGVCDVFSSISAGAAVNFPVNNVSKCGNIISAAPDRGSAIESAQAAARSILIRLDPADPKTADFLGLRYQGTENRDNEQLTISNEQNNTSSFLIPHSSLSKLQSPTPIPYSLLTAHCSLFPAHYPLPTSPCFPPNAYQASTGLLEALEKLPETCGSGELRLYPFPEFTDSGLQDFLGRSIQEALAAIRKLTGLALPESPVSSDNDTKGPRKKPINSGVSITVLGRSFWAAFIRGSYQGAVYYIDQFTQNDGKKTGF